MQLFVPRYKVSLNDSRPRHLGVSGSSPRGGHPHKPPEEACLGTQNLGHRAHIRSMALWTVWSPGLDRPGVRPNEQNGRLESCLLLCQPPRDLWGVTTPYRWPGSEQDDFVQNMRVGRYKKVRCAMLGSCTRESFTSGSRME